MKKIKGWLVNYFSPEKDKFEISDQMREEILRLKERILQ